MNCDSKYLSRRFTILDSLTQTIGNPDLNLNQIEGDECSGQNVTLIPIGIVGAILPLSAVGWVGLFTAKSSESANRQNAPPRPPHCQKPFCAR